jgi:2-aminoadipate transaminase
MRLNFSASNEEELNEGIRRIGGVVSEQVALYETITGEHRSTDAGSEAPGPGREAEEPGADVVPMPRRR